MRRRLRGDDGGIGVGSLRSHVGRSACALQRRQSADLHGGKAHCQGQGCGSIGYFSRIRVLRALMADGVGGPFLCGTKHRIVVGLKV